MPPEATRTAHELQMLEGMVDCAHMLGMTLGAAAKAERDTTAMLTLVEAYQKCFLGVRMGLRLCMTLRAPPKATPSPKPERADTPEHPEPLEQERPEQSERPEPLERERERDYEPVSLPTFLSTLGLVARSTERLGDGLPATDALPKLKALLAEVSEPRISPISRTPDGPPSSVPSAKSVVQAAGLAVLTRPPPTAIRRNLLGSAAPPRPAPPCWPNSG